MKLFGKRILESLWLLVAVNFICFLLSMPVLVWFYVRLNLLFSAALTVQVTDFFPGISYFSVFLLRLPAPAYYLLLTVTLPLLGPAAMGLACVLRYVAWEASPVFSVFWRGLRTNVKQGLLFGIADFAVTNILAWSAFGMFSSDIPALSAMLAACRWLSLPALFFCGLMRPYLYLIAVTVRQSAVRILKNAWLFAFLGLSRNAVSLLLCLCWWAFTVTFVPVVSLVALPFITYTFTGLLSVRCCFPPVQARIIEPAQKKEEA